MIRYRLQCRDEHEFEAWFRNSATYERQVRRGDVVCPECGAAEVSKAMMAPGLATRTGDTKEPVPSVAPETAKRALMQRGLLALMRDLRRQVEQHAEDVGPRFAEEARKIHYEEVEARGIYG